MVCQPEMEELKRPTRRLPASGCTYTSSFISSSAKMIWPS